MRVLLISYFFPPYNVIGAVRLSKIAKYLTRFGHDVRVVTAADQPLQATLPLEIPEERVRHTPWANVNRPVEVVLGGRKRVAARGFAPPSGRLRGVVQGLGDLYKNLVHFPDGQVGWLPYAVRGAEALMADGWRPDVIYASGSPWTSLVAAHRVGRRHGIPWVGELRDLWVDNPYGQLPAWRKPLDVMLERRVLSSAAGLVAVSEPSVATLREKYGLPCAVVLNGLDREDYPADAKVPHQDGIVRIVYTGRIYEGKRDPTPLYRAIASLGPLAERVRVAFYGRYLDAARRLAAAQGVEHLVEVHDPISYEEALRVQAEADLLLLLLWDDPRERGICPGKVYEYIGARRPILALGRGDNVAAQLVSGRGIGMVTTDPDEIAARLRGWIEEKDRGGIGATPEEALAGLSREDQSRRLESFLQTLL